MPIRQAVLGLFTLLVCTTRAVLVNRIIDDTNGDPTTGLKPVYLPNGPWNGPSCSGCAINPNTSLAHDGTWSAATYHPNINNMNITFSFTGAAIWVFFILANANDLACGITSNTVCNITVDGLLVQNYTSPQPNENTPAYQYNVTGYSTDQLGTHTMVISTNDYPTSVYLDFDYVIYTIDEPNITTSSTSGPSSTSSIAATSESAAAHHPSSNNSNKAGIIVGCVLGGLALVAILILFRRSRIKRNWPIEPIITSFNEQPFRGLVSSSAPLVPVRREGQSPRAPNRKDRGRDELRALRHMEIDSRLQTAQREMQNLASRQEAQSGPGPSSGDVEREGSGLEMVQMEAIHEQIRQLRTQMSQLRMERSSNWTQDAAPPPY